MALLERLLAHGYIDIRCNVRRRSDIPKLDALLGPYPDARFEYCLGNLRYREDAARAVNDVQLIFHLAAGKKGTAADLFLDSVVASRNLLEAVADRRPLRIVLVSSFGVYGVAGIGRGARVNEQTVLEPHPEWRDHYSYSKLRQEQLFWEYQQRNNLELVVLRPGVIYGPDGGHFSNRVGLAVANWQLHFGGSNLLPLSYVDNCAEALVVAGGCPEAAGQVYNVHDDNLPTSRQYLRAYKKQVTKIRSISVPYFGLQLFSSMITKYNRYSKGQLPAILTPYKVASMWGGNRFDNSKLRSIGWKQLVPTAEGLRRTFAAFRTRLSETGVNETVFPVMLKKPVDVSTEIRQRNAEFVVGAALGPNSNGNFEHLLAASSSLRRAGRTARVLVFGPHDPRHLHSAASLDGLNSHVQLVPDELSACESLKQCDVLVSLQGGVPLVVLQAMSSRIPIITTAIRIPEALENQPRVRFIRENDQCGLEEELLRLSGQPKQKAIANLVHEENISKHYSNTYLWRDSEPQAAHGPVTKWRALIKRVLFSTVPSGQLLEHGNRDMPQIALTIDDGPDPTYTPRILDILRDLAVTATFFVVGGAAEQYPQIVARMKKEGHEVGSHSYSHPHFHRLSWSGAMREIAMTRWVLDRILGEKCNLFRPPHGKLSLRSLLPAWASGQHVVMWNVDLKDYRASAGEVEAQLDRTSFSSGDIILYHGVNDAALKALPHVLKAALNNGRTAVTISQLFCQKSLLRSGF
jgi:peptidoglycan/xylan/chitin deacetylase (PgdA/CDA1 family)/nucleoside-diphosphate-sugar epimerase